MQKIILINSLIILFTILCTSKPTYGLAKLDDNVNNDLKKEELLAQKFYKYTESWLHEMDEILDIHVKNIIIRDTTNKLLLKVKFADKTLDYITDSMLSEDPVKIFKVYQFLLDIINNKLKEKDRQEIIDTTFITYVSDVVKIWQEEFAIWKYAALPEIDSARTFAEMWNEFLATVKEKVSELRPGLCFFGASM